MLLPLIFVFVLVVMIGRAAKKFNTSSTGPLTFSILVFMVFDDLNIQFPLHLSAI